MRALWIALALLAFAAAPAFAQDDDPLDDGDDVELVEPTPTPTPDPCERGGADAQYADCSDPCEGADVDYGADGDYAYCPQIVPQFTGGPPPRRDPPPRAVAAPAQLQTLPLTGPEVVGTALFGLAFLLGGSGLRLILR